MSEKPPKTPSLFVADESPKSRKSEDEFGRYSFAARIAKLISSRTDQSCLVMSVHGNWGEGKTTVLNFVEAELSVCGNIEIVRFNPWRYTYSEDILTQFYSHIAKSSGGKIKPLADLIRSNLENISPAAKLFDYFNPGVGTAGKTVVDLATAFLPKSNIEKLKKRAGEILVEAGTKIVVIVDDIDRLDSEEIAELFALIKINADLDGITYLLSFEQGFVEDALERKYSCSGKHFLEKLIQLPLNLPPIDRQKLEAFWRDGVFRILTEFSLEESWSQENLERLRSVISFVGGRLKSPRQSIHHWNAFRFALAGLKNEVNYADLIAIEWVRIESPTIHQYIHANRDFFLGLTYSTYSENKDEQFSKLSAELGEEEAQRGLVEVRNLLFPSSRDEYGLTEWARNWYTQKRVCSKNYFDRYFHSGLQTGEISEEDVRLILTADDSLLDDWLGVFQGHLRKNPEKIVDCLQLRKAELSLEAIGRIPTFLLTNAELLPEHGEADFSSPKLSAAFLIRSCFEELVSFHQPLADFIRQLIQDTPHSGIALLCESIYVATDSQEAKWQLPKSVSEKILPVLVAKLKEEAKEDFERWFWHFSSFYRQLSASGWKVWIESLIRGNNDRAFEILKASAPKCIPSGEPSNLNIECYQLIGGQMDIELFVSALKNSAKIEVPVELPEKFPEKRDGSTLSDPELLTQFLWIHSYRSGKGLDRKDESQPEGTAGL